MARVLCYEYELSAMRGDTDSEIEYVSQTTSELMFNPVTHDVAQYLCKKLDCSKGGEDEADIEVRALGPPCKTVEILGDGNCFFRAVSESICGTDEYHETLRDAVVCQLESHETLYRPMLREGYGSVSEYINVSKMRTLGSWATEVEIQAAADWLGVSIYTYHSQRWLLYKCRTTQVSERGLYLENRGVRVSNQGLYLENRGVHYDTVICVQKPCAEGCYGYCNASAAESGSGSWISDEDEMLEDDRDNAPENGRGSRNYDEMSDDDRCRTEEERKERDWHCPSSDDPGHRVCDYLGFQPTEMPASKADRMLCQTLLSWAYFISHLGDNWWGSVPDTLLTNIMSDPYYQDGALAVSTYQGNLATGLFTLTSKTPSGIRGCSAYLLHGVYRCTGLAQETFTDPYDLLNRVIRQVPSGHLIPAPIDLDYKTIVHSAQGTEEQVLFEGNTIRADKMNTLLGWLLNRWWGSTSADKIERYMRDPRRREGDIIVAQSTGTSLYEVFSITVKTKDFVIPVPVIAKGERYSCALVQGVFPDPLSVIKQLRTIMPYMHLLPYSYKGKPVV